MGRIALAGAVVMVLLGLISCGTLIESDRASLAVLKDYTAARVSSEDRPGNADFRPLEGGQTLTLAELEGPGEITHLWMTIASADPYHFTNMVLRIYYDGNLFPSVESPVGDFFGLGQSKMYYFDNEVQAIGTNRGLNCFWPMPFAKSARIELTNEGDIKAGAVYYYVDWRQLKRFPKDRGYFHAQYRQDFPNPDGEPYLILDTEGGRGHYLGVSLTVHTQVEGWWGEGDDIFTIDGETRPSLWGTGSEDYFCGAWCYGDTFYNDYFGMPYREKDNHDSDNFWNVYRHHIENPIAFDSSLEVEIEHGHHGFDNTRKRGWNNDYSSVAYWYMDRPVPLKGVLAKAEERISAFRPLVIPPHIVELQQCDISTSSDDVRAHVQGMGGFMREGAAWYYDDQLFCGANEKDSVVTLSFETNENHQGRSVLHLTRSWDYGTIRVALDDRVLVDAFNGYSEKVASVLIDLGEMELPAGTHVLEITTLGKDDRSTGHLWGADYLRFGGKAPEMESQTQRF